MDSCKSATTPWVDGTVLKKCEKQCKDIDAMRYQSLIGGLMYLAVISRPDIAHVVSKLSQFNNHPHEEHFKAAKHVLRYLKQSSAAKITYSSTGENLVCYTDSDWAGDVSDRKSCSGYVIFMSDGLVSWESKKQSIVALSTMEAEYIALCQGAKDVVFLRTLLREMGYDGYVNEPTNMHCDNQSAQFLLKHPMVHKRSKRIDLRFHYVRELFEKGEIEVHFVNSDANAADIMTKFLKKLKHKNGCKLLKLTM
ncbi:uncharacterized protein LOC129246416 [Anastrepha obliqua]|uniref:uncharacterized protein LOC129246416 n=1 Tax=Anastrepha obliqua TaxID=95512 RepID=UPI002409A5F9|nr:uncharacterized protein LOC129246416 [Anastrepha obliqua]